MFYLASKNLGNSHVATKVGMMFTRRAWTIVNPSCCTVIS